MSPLPGEYDGVFIQALGGPEPMREGECPWFIEVGKPFNGEVVTRIEHREDNRGDHGIGWFDACSDTRRIASFNERHVAEVIYAEPPAKKNIPAGIDAGVRITL